MSNISDYRREQRRASREAYEAIKDSGRLTSMKLQALRGVVELGECTGAELDAWAAGGPMRGHLHKRLGELHRLQVVERAGQRRCRVTGQRATTWRATGGMPVEDKVPPRLPRAALEKRVVELEALVGELQSKVVEYEERLGIRKRRQQSLFDEAP